MKGFFHFYPKRIQRRTGRVLVFTAVFCAEICIAAFFVLIFNFITARNSQVILQMLMIIGGVILTGMCVCFAMAELSHKKIRRSSRYTYVDIQDKAVVFSSYAGEYRVSGEKIIVRDLYYIPFEKLRRIEPEKNGRGIILTGDIRHFCMNSDNLGYHVKDGDIVFDREWLNIGGSEQAESVRIPAVFGNPERLSLSIREAYKKFIETPKPKPYVFREADFIRRRAKPRVMPEEFGYKRNW